METTKNGITVDYSGSVGESTATISAVANEGIDKVETFDFKAGDVTKTVEVSQPGLREKYLFADGGELPMYVLKMQPTSPYTELDFIRATGTQHINTGISLKTNHEVYLRIRLADLNNCTIIGKNSGNTNARWVLLFVASGTKFQLNRNTAVAHPKSDIVANTWYSIIINASQFKVNDSTTALTSTSIAEAFNAYLFANHYTGSASPFRGDCSNCNIELNGTALRTFKPVRLNQAVEAKADVAGSTAGIAGEVGLWDEANDCFFGNQGGGNFIGSDEL